MKTPPLLLGMALVFWGFETGYQVIGLVAAVLVELPRLIQIRWDIQPQDFYRIADLSAIIFMVLAVYWYAADGPNAAWLAPLAFFPLLGAQAYSTVGGVDWGAVSWTARQRSKKRKDTTRRLTDFSYPYFALIIFSASAGNSRTPYFYAGLFVLTAYALWWNRSKRFPVWVWGGLILGIGVAGWVGHIGLHQLHLYVEDQFYAWTLNRLEDKSNPFFTVSAIGEVGRIKLSDRILFRVMPAKNRVPPTLLRESSFNRYFEGRWLSVRPGFKNLNPQPGFVWELAPQPKISLNVTISEYLDQGQGLLKIPAGAYRIDGLAAGQLEVCDSGTLQVHDGPGLATYTVHYGAGSPRVAPPNESDYIVPDDERPALARTAEQIGLFGRNIRDAQHLVSNWFNTRFTYSLDLPDPGQDATPLSRFLELTRTGHCEYFATAAVLLLRTAGFPARYVNGYVVEEYSTLEKAYVVRGRHAHAWAMVYHNGAWHNFDATPGGWIGAEQEKTSWWQPLMDLTGWLWYQFSAWRYGATRAEWLKYLVWPLIGLLVLLVFRIRSQRTVLKDKKIKTGRTREKAAVVKSPLYILEKHLASKGYIRPSWQTLSEFIAETTRNGGLDRSVELDRLLDLHYRLRFDPRGLNDAEKDRLNQGVEVYMAGLERGIHGRVDR